MLVSRTDLVADGGDSALGTIARVTAALCVVTDRGGVDAEVLLGIDRPADAAAPVVGVPGTYRTWTIDVGLPTLDELRAVLERIPGDVLRAKGLVECVDEPDPIEVHVVGGRRSVRHRRDLPVELGRRQLVVIGLATTHPIDS